MKNCFLFATISGLLLLSCRNDVPAAPGRTPVPVEKPKKNDVPNPKPFPEKTTTTGNTSMR